MVWLGIGSIRAVIRSMQRSSESGCLAQRGGVRHFVHSWVACGVDCGREVGPSEVGEHHDLPVLDEITAKTDNGQGMIVPADFTVSLLVQKELYFGQFPITQLSGFKDELRGGIITNTFTVGLLSPDEVERNWKRIADVDEASVKAVVTLMGLECWIA